MDTSRQVPDGITSRIESLGAAPRQRRRIAEKRRIVEETMVEGASVARVARAHGINANQVFGWRRFYVAGRLGDRDKTSQSGRTDLLRTELVCRKDLACMASSATSRLEEVGSRAVPNLRATELCPSGQRATG